MDLKEVKDYYQKMKLEFIFRIRSEPKLANASIKIKKNTVLEDARTTVNPSAPLN